MLGGCIIAMACDYRVMLSLEGKPLPRIGLNEVALGMEIPWWIVDFMRKTVGSRQTERLVGRALLVPADEALKVGLIDQGWSARPLPFLFPLRD